MHVLNEAQESDGAGVMMNILRKKLIIYHKIKKIIKQTAQKYCRIHPMDLQGHLELYQINLRSLEIIIFPSPR